MKTAFSMRFLTLVAIFLTAHSGSIDLFFAPLTDECDYVVRIKHFVNGLYDGSGLGEQKIMFDCKFQTGSFLAQLYDIFMHSQEMPDTAALVAFLFKELPSLASRAYLSFIDCRKDYGESETFLKYLSKYFNAPNFSQFITYKIVRNSTDTSNDAILFKEYLDEGNYYEAGKIIGSWSNRFIFSNLRK